jgi:gas vesicle protein
MEKIRYKHLNKNKMENSNNTGKMLGVMLLGGAIGATLGVLFAPAKGSDTRRKISRKGSDLSDELQDKFETFMDDVKAEIDMVKNKATELINGEVNKLDSKK